jgi:hypothetical protein
MMYLRPIQIAPDDFIELMMSLRCSCFARTDLEGFQFQRIDEHGKVRHYITVGNFPELLARVSAEIDGRYSRQIL